MFTLKFGKKNAGTRSIQDCVNQGIIAYGLISADSDVYMILLNVNRSVYFKGLICCLFHGCIDPIEPHY